MMKNIVRRGLTCGDAGSDVVTSSDLTSAEAVLACGGDYWWLCERPSNTCTSITDNLIVTLIDPTKATLCSSSHFLILQAESAYNSNTGVVLILRYSEIKFPFCLFHSQALINLVR